MSRATENREEILKIHGAIDLINQRIDTIENNHLTHMQKDMPTQRTGSTCRQRPGTSAGSRWNQGCRR